MKKIAKEGLLGFLDGYHRTFPWVFVAVVAWMFGVSYGWYRARTDPPDPPTCDQAATACYKEQGRMIVKTCEAILERASEK